MSEKKIIDFDPGDPDVSDPLDPIIHVIRESMPAEKIFLLGTYQANPEILGLEYDLLVLIQSADKRPVHEFESLIANRSHDFAMVTASVYKIDVINRLLEQGNLFFSHLCHPQKLIFSLGADELKKTELRNLAFCHDFIKAEFCSLISKSKAFLSGAICYQNTQDHQLAAFMIHQTVEHCLNAFLSPLMGYRMKTHNLNKLFLHARRFSVQFYKIFPRNSDREIQLYQTLHKAYIYGRYKNTFQVAEELLQILVARASSLLELTEYTFNQKLGDLRLGRNDIFN